MASLHERVDAYLLAHGDEWIALGRELQRLPELGYRETETSRFVREYLVSCGVQTLQTHAITGVRGELPGGGQAKLAVMAELDAVLSLRNPLANPDTGAAHACGHHMQVTALLALCKAFSETGILSELGGSLVLLGVPSEETQPPDFLADLCTRGLTGGGSGKQEFLRAGVLDDLDAILTTHALVNTPEYPDLAMGSPSCNGFHTLQAEFLGKSAHAGMAPWEGKNALSAAVLAIQGVQAQRESYADSDCVRLACNLTEGGLSLGTVPDRAILRLQARAKYPGALADVVEKLRTACRCAAQTLGCEVTLTDEHGYGPYLADEGLLSLMEEQASALTGGTVRRREHGYYSSDLGEICGQIPTAQIVVGGFSGALHGADFRVDNEALAYVLPARILAASAVALLEHGAARLNELKSHFRIT